MRLLPITLLSSMLAITFHANVNANADNSANGQICHNGKCWDLGDIGSECCPFSDERLKTDIHRLENPTENILKLRGVAFNWKQNNQPDVGLVAQDVQKVYPQLVRSEAGHLQVDYQKLVAPLIESVRELNERIRILELAAAEK